MSFSYRASRIIEDTLNAAQQAEEMDGIETLEEYVRVMSVLRDEFEYRAQVALGCMLEGAV